MKLEAGRYEYQYKGRRIEIIDARRHHGHNCPHWLVAIDGVCDYARETKGEALEAAKAQIDHEEKQTNSGQ